MKKLFTLLLLQSFGVFWSTSMYGQTTYTWNVASGAWNTAASWTPARSTPATNDVLVFDGSTQASPIVTDIQTETIGQLIVINSASVKVTALTAAKTLTVAGGSGTDLDIQAGSTFRLDGAIAITISLSTTVTSSIAGTFIATSDGTVAVAHKLLAADASSIAVTGSVVQGHAAGALIFTGNLFGNTGTANIANFAAGSTYIQRAGSNPFALTQPASKVVFSPTSTYKFYLSGSPALTGRTFGDFIVGEGANCNPTVNLSADCIMFNITQESGAAIAWTNTGTAAAGTMRIRGNISQAGTFKFVLANNGVGGIVFEGSSPQSISGAGTNATVFVSNTTINNANGITLNRAITINDTLNLNAGKITTSSSNLLTIDTLGNVIGGNAFSSVNGTTSYVDGPMAFNIKGTVSTTKRFVIGKATDYRLLTFMVTHDAATPTLYTAEVFNAAPTSRALPGTIDRVSSAHYWNIIKGAGANATAASVELMYGANDVVLDPSNLRVVKDDGAGNWLDLGGVGSGFPGGTIASTLNFTSFSDFTLGNNTGGGNPLPIQLFSFTGTYQSNGVQLNWRTLSEINNYGFEVQRSVNSENGFVSLANSFTPGNGTTNVPHDYSYLDGSVPSGTWFYRLKQIDLDGTIHFTDPIEISGVTAVEENVPVTFVLSQNYPNPFNPETKISYTLAKPSAVTLTVYTVTGQEIISLVNEQKSAGRYEVVWNAPSAGGARVASGIYFYRIVARPADGSAPFTELKKMVLLK